MSRSWTAASASTCEDQKTITATEGESVPRVFMVDNEGFGCRGGPTPRPFTVFDFIAPVVAPVKVRNRWKAFQAEDVEDKQSEDYGDKRPLDNGNR